MNGLQRLVLVLSLVALCLLIIGLAASKPPLTDVHWDTPGYILKGKAFVEGRCCRHFANDSELIAQEVFASSETGASPNTYWHFTRFGNIALHGAVIWIFGGTYKALIALKWTYVIIFLATFPFLVLVAKHLSVLLDDSKNFGRFSFGLLISLLLLTLSDIFYYLLGNGVSEVVMLFLLSASTFGLLLAMKRSSYLLALLAGFFVFLLYVVRMESVWYLLSFLAALFIFCRRASPVFWPTDRDWRMLLVAMGFSASLFCIYSFYYFPLTNPVLFLEFIRLDPPPDGKLTESHSHLSDVLVAGGLLWVGAALALISTRRSNYVGMALVWLVISLLPTLPTLLSGREVQARMFTFVIPPLFLLSIYGWSIVIQRVFESKKYLVLGFSVFACVFLVATSQTSSYSYLREFPGLWRLQQIRLLLVVARYERKDYQAEQLERISACLDLSMAPAVIASSSSLTWEHLATLKFLKQSMAAVDSPACAAHDETVESDLNLSDGSKKANPTDYDVAALPADNEKIWDALGKGKIVYLLRRPEESIDEMFAGGPALRERLVAKTTEYTLTHLYLFEEGAAGG